MEIIHDHKKKIIAIVGAGIVALILKNSKKKDRSNMNIEKLGKNGKKMVLVDSNFFYKLLKLLKIAIPRLIGKETISIFVLSGLLIARTVLSIWVQDLKGSWVRAIVKRDMPKFINKMIVMTLYSFPSAVVNSGLTYINNILGLYFRQNITSYFQKEYLKSMCFYQITNLDVRIANPDQIFSSDIELWANSVANLYSNVSKPLLDLILMIRKLSETMGYEGPVLMMFWYVLSAILLKYVSPPFGSLIATGQSTFFI